MTFIMSPRSVLLFALFCAMAVANPIKQPGVGCGTMFIREADCAPQPASVFWPFNATLQFPPGSGQKQVNLLIAGVGVKADRWSLVFQPTPLINTCPDSTVASCGSPSLPCANSLCDSSLGSLCWGTTLSGAAGSSQTISFGLRKNNNGGSDCAVTIIVYLSDNGSNGRATCPQPLQFQAGCAGAIYAGVAGPVTWAGAAYVLPMFITGILAVVAMLM